MSSEETDSWITRAASAGWQCGLHGKILVCFAVYCLVYGSLTTSTALFVGSVDGLLVAAGHIAAGLGSFAIALGVARGRSGSYSAAIIFTIVILAFLVYWVEDIPFFIPFVIAFTVELLLLLWKAVSRRPMHGR